MTAAANTYTVAMESELLSGCHASCPREPSVLLQGLTVLT